MIEYRATCKSCDWVSLTYDDIGAAESARLRHEGNEGDHETWMCARPVLRLGVSDSTDGQGSWC